MSEDGDEDEINKQETPKNSKSPAHGKKRFHPVEGEQQFDEELGKWVGQDEPLSPRGAGDDDAAKRQRTS